MRMRLMSYSSCLIDCPQSPLVLDTSVVINLYACGRAEDILDALPHRIFVPQIAAGELGKGTEEARPELAILQVLLSGPLLDIPQTHSTAFGMYHTLIPAPPKTQTY